eukprot:Colp12_sorted_trinity150504_noHs@25097
MVETLNRLKDVAGIPRVAHRTPAQLFERIEAEKGDLVTWVGELYLELHRGTYTSHAANKKGNRQSELGLCGAEFLSVLTGLDSRASLAPLWEYTLLNQFHDVLPGSAIGMVYEDSARLYKEVLEGVQDVTVDAMTRLLAQLDEKARTGSKQTAHGMSVLAVNTLGWARREVVCLPSSDLPNAQKAATGGCYVAVDVPALGYANVPLTPTALSAQPGHTASATTNGANKYTLENSFVRAVVCGGRVVSLVHKPTQRECAVEGGSAGPLNTLRVFEDTPLYWDAWDVEVYHLEKSWLVEEGTCTLLESGPLVASVVAKYHVGKASTVTQTITLTATSPALLFKTEVDWHERHLCLKAEFPLSVRAPAATYGVQYGHLQRPTHTNTSWDMAKFEVVGHGWMDVSEYDFGVGLIADYKYGFGTRGNVARISLLRSPKAPDAEQDMGAHSFTYGILPHAGRPQEGQVMQTAVALASPLRIATMTNSPGCKHAAKMSLFASSHAGLVVDTVKWAEDSDDVIVRAYEAYGGTITTPHVRCGRAVARAVVVDLLEQHEQQVLDVNNNGLCIALPTMAPFKLLSIKISFA